MPIYEFYCPDNNKVYSFLARSVAHSDKVPRCPDNPKYRMVKLISQFAVTGKAKEPAADGDDLDDIDESKMEAVMREMEADMTGMDEDNPDPRRLGRMMRKFSEVAGENMPAGFDEMIGRLEAGEDPEKLEEQYGDLLDNDAEGEQLWTDKTHRRSRSRRKPQHDETLYNMSDYLNE